MRECQRMISGNSIIHVATMIPEDFMYVVKVWASYTDGFAMISAIRDYPLHWNVKHYKKIPMFIISPGDQLQLGLAFCTVRRIIPDYDCKYCDTLWSQYGYVKNEAVGYDGEKEERVILKTKIDRAFVLGEKSRLSRRDWTQEMILLSSAVKSDAIIQSDVNYVLRGALNITKARSRRKL